MRKEKLVTIGIIIVILSIAGAIIYSKNAGFTVKDTPSEEVAKYIGENSVLYIQEGCSHCERQLELFGDNKRYLNIIDCSQNSTTAAACFNAGIEGTPTWIINGEQYIGFQSIDKLKELTGYLG